MGDVDDGGDEAGVDVVGGGCGADGAAVAVEQSSDGGVGAAVCRERAEAKSCDQVSAMRDPVARGRTPREASRTARIYAESGEVAGGGFCPAPAKDAGAAVTDGRVPDVAHPAISVVASRQQSPDLMAAAKWGQRLFWPVFYSSLCSLARRRMR